jgi:hypothetical protein
VVVDAKYYSSDCCQGIKTVEQIDGFLTCRGKDGTDTVDVSK